jgi:glycosyltransferase involved in cell wall biosynthesis
MLRGTIIAMKQKKIDLVIATSTPLTIGIPALILKKWKKIPYVFEVRDLWPEVPIQMGIIRNMFLKKITRWLEKLIYCNATHIIALSPGIADGVLSSGISPDKIVVIPNMSKIDKFYPREKNFELMRELGLNENSFKVIHFGALGYANGIKLVVESIKLLKNNGEIEFIFIGGGMMEEELQRECQKSGLENVFFMGNFPMEKTSDIVNFCDVSLVSFLNIPILYTNSPNKLFDSLSAGKPIIVNSAGWTKKLVEENACGYYVDPDIPSDLIEKLFFMKNNQKLLEEMGWNARRLAEIKYDKSLLCKQFSDVISKL